MSFLPVISSWGSAETSEVMNPDATHTPLQLVTDLAVDRAFRAIPYSDIMSNPVVGMAYLTQFGEEYPLKWAQSFTTGQLLKASEFGNIIHNNAPGYVAMKRGFTGPQVVLTHGDVLTCAETMLQERRASIVVCCVADVEPGARALVLCYASDELIAQEQRMHLLKRSAPSLQRFDWEWDSVTHG